MVQRKLHLINLFILFAFVAVLFFGCEGKPVKEIRAVDSKNGKVLILRGDKTTFVKNYDTDIVIFGGSIGGIASALAVCSSGRNVLLMVESDGIGACFPDTSKYYESKLSETGISKNYRMFKQKINEWYAKKNLIQPKSGSVTFSGLLDYNSGDFCFDGKAAEEVINEMLNTLNNRGQLTIVTRQKPVEMILGLGGRISSVNIVDLDKKVVNQVTSWMYIDATETGDLIPLAGLAYTIGKESRKETQEPHASETADSSSTMKFLYYDASLIDRNAKSGIYELPLIEIKPSGSVIDSIAIAVEPRRLKTVRIVNEMDISAEFQKGPRAEFFKDAVSIGYSPIILGENEIVSTKPFQIPASCLVPEKITSLIMVGPSIGATYVASKALTVSWVQWAVGEGAGEFASFCTGIEGGTGKALKSDADLKLFHEVEVQNLGLPVYWYDNVTPEDEIFSKAQLLPFNDPGYDKALKNLSYAH